MINNNIFTKLLNFFILVLIFVTPVSIALTNYIAFIILVLWVFEGNFKYKISNMSLNKTTILFYIFIFFMLISLLWSKNIYGGFYSSGYHNALIYWLKYYFLYSILSIIIITSFRKENIAKAIDSFLLIMFITEIISYGIIFHLWKIGKGIPSNPSPFLNHSTYSVLLSIAIFIILNKLIKTNSLKFKFIYIIFLFTSTANLFFNTGRTGQLSFFITLVVYFSIKYRVTIKSILISSLVSIIFFISMYFANSIFFNRINALKNDFIQTTHYNYDTSAGARYGAILVSLDLIQKHPFLGEGLGYARASYIKTIKDSAIYSKSKYLIKVMSDLHNQYMQVLIEVGIVGFVIFLLFIYYFYKEKIYDIEFKTISIIFMTSLLAGFFGGSLLRMYEIYVLFVIFLGLYSIDSTNKIKLFN